MLSFASTILLAAPLLAAAADVVPSRVERRTALLELLQHQHEKRQTENYGTTDVCDAAPAANNADFIELQVGQPFPGAVFSFTYASDDAACQTINKCENVCIEDADICIGYVFDGTCTVYGSNAYSNNQVTNVPFGFRLIQNAGTVEGSVATCASKVTGPSALDVVSEVNGSCMCGPGRATGDNLFVCEAIPVPAGAFRNEPQTLTRPVSFSTPFTYSVPLIGVPAVLDAAQCQAICIADVNNCQAVILRSEGSLNKCWKIGADGVYSNPADGPSVNQRASRMAKRQATGIVGSIGAPGDIFVEVEGSTLVNDAALAPSAAAGQRMRTKRYNSQVQW